jgi:hypothetical protein
MTISIGLIPNENTAMLIQDSEGSYIGLGFEQDIFKKIRDIDKSSITGVIGSFTTANETLELVSGRQFKSSFELRDNLEQAYHAVRKRHLERGTFQKYGFSDIREIIAPPREIQIDPAVRDEILNSANDKNHSFSLEFMLASNYNQPQLSKLEFPGISHLFNNPKDYTVGGSGSILAIEKMGSVLKNYRWQNTLSNDEGIEILMKAGNASEQHTGVGGPFEIVYVTKIEGKPKIIRPDRKKINMVMYIQNLTTDEETITESIKKMRDHKINSLELSDYIKTKTNVGIEFNKYFNI